MHSSDKQIGDESHLVHSPHDPNLMQPGVEPNLVHSPHDLNLMQPDLLHVDGEPYLVRYFEKLVGDEVLFLQLCARFAWS